MAEFAIFVRLKSRKFMAAYSCPTCIAERGLGGGDDLRLAERLAHRHVRRRGIQQLCFGDAQVRRHRLRHRVGPHEERVPGDAGARARAPGRLALRLEAAAGRLQDRKFLRCWACQCGLQLVWSDLAPARRAASCCALEAAAGILQGETGV